MGISSVCNLTTWLSLFISCGDVNRSCVASDTRFEMTTDRIQYLHNQNISIVGRYLTGGDFKELRVGEPSRILDNNLYFFPIFQESGTELSYFTPNRGVQDAVNATIAAKNHRIPKGSVIYFAVDTDPQDSQINNIILPYFKALRNEMMTSQDGYYQIGIYSTRNTCNKVINKGYALTCMVSDMSTGYSGNMGFNMPNRWNFDQFYEIRNINTNNLNWDLDKDAYSGRIPPVTALSTTPMPFLDRVTLLKNKIYQFRKFK